jgi:exonuclease VII large subunit
MWLWYGILIVATIFVTPCGAEENRTIKEVLDGRKTFDKQVVAIQGETIGCALKDSRRQQCWVNIRDNTAAIGVVFDCVEAKKISFFASYKSTGDQVRVEGVFNNTCPDHRTETDIHAQRLKIISLGSLREEHVSEKKLRRAEMLGIISLFLGLVYFIKKELTR